ncbi:MAG: efflux RND transporter periplasmic adaptor subunit [Alphaproteobacteria bacterium]|nr:efflux RND transporter periplasmic adaptor subunit [Alphaproteobacteria bacterium]
MKRIIFIFAILAIAIAGYSLFSYTTKNDKEIILHGNVNIRDVNLGFRVFGRLQVMNYEEGDRVKKGDILATLDQEPYEDNLKAAKADIEDKTAIFKNAQQNLVRKKELVKTKTASQQAYDEAIAGYNSALAGLHAAEANLAQAQINYADTHIQSPTDGTIITRIREPGSIVQPGESIYILSTDESIWVRAFIHENQLGKVYPGMKALVYTDSAPSTPYEATVGFISPVAEFTPKNVETSELRTKLVYRIRVIIDKKDLGLRQGMPVTIKLETNDRH